MKSPLNNSKTVLKDKALRKTKANSRTGIARKAQKQVQVTYKKPTRIWSDTEGRYVEMTEADQVKYRQHLERKAAARGDNIKIKYRDEARAQFSNAAAAKVATKPEVSSGKRKSLWDQMHQKKGSAK